MVSRINSRTGNREGRKELAKETMRVIEALGYHNEQGAWVDIKKSPHSIYYDEFHHFTTALPRKASLRLRKQENGSAPKMALSVTTETAQQAAERLLGIHSAYTQQLVDHASESGHDTYAGYPTGSDAHAASSSEDVVNNDTCAGDTGSDAHAASSSGDAVNNDTYAMGYATGSDAHAATDGSSSSRKVAMLNFASARNPGGGFLNGSVAQEECLSRSSNLYPALLECPQFYHNWKLSRGAGKDVSGANVYTDRIIYTTDVSFFRDDAGDLLENCYQVDVVTCASVNRLRRRDAKTNTWKKSGGRNKKEDDDSSREEQQLDATCRETMIRRAGKVLQACVENGAEILILGAWGTGVFGNETAEVALWFAEALRILNQEKKMHGIEEIVFPIPEAPKADEFRAALLPHLTPSTATSTAATTPTKAVVETIKTKQTKNENSNTMTKKKRWSAR